MSNDKMIVAVVEAILTFLGVFLGRVQGGYPPDTTCVLLSFVAMIGYVAIIIWWNHQDRKSWRSIHGKETAFPEEYRTIFSSGWFFAGGLVFFMMIASETDGNLLEAPLLTAILSGLVSIVCRRRQTAKTKTA